MSGGFSIPYLKFLLWNSECFAFIKLEWYIYPIVRNAPEGSKATPHNPNINISSEKHEYSH